jgi:hypothetical protein
MNHEEATIKAFIIPVRQERYFGIFEEPEKESEVHCSTRT